MTTGPMSISPKLNFMPPDDSGAGTLVHEARLDGIGATVVPFKASYFIVQPGCLSPIDTHSVHEVWMVAQGEGELTYDGEPSPLHPMDFIYLEPPKKHQVRNTGAGPLMIVSVWWK